MISFHFCSLIYVWVRNVQFNNTAVCMYLEGYIQQIIFLFKFLFSPGQVSHIFNVESACYSGFLQAMCVPTVSRYSSNNTTSFILDYTASLSEVLQLGTLYQQPLNTYLHHPVSAAISKLTFFAGHITLIHPSTFCDSLV